VLWVTGQRTPELAAWSIFLLALFSQFLCDFVVSTGRTWFAFGVQPHAQLAKMASVWSVDAALAPIALFVALVSTRYQYAFLGVAPLLALIGVFGQERRIRIDNALELGHAYRGTAFLLGGLIEADDRATGLHSRDVVELAVEVAKRMGLDAHDLRNTELVALLHDVGKIRVPKEIINKPGPLTDTEWLVVKQHTVWGEEMLAAVGGLLGEVGSIVRSCHERFDGHGYPDELSGESIPLVARIIFVCDAFSAMTTDRPYRKGRSAADALAELRLGAGTQFDPRVVAVLAATLDDADGGEGETDRPQLTLVG
jgi:HD-GYP domain-containing protein (c-di-GMP phosphodiesterase class II)